jgi:hypothetical protein
MVEARILPGQKVIGEVKCGGQGFCTLAGHLKTNVSRSELQTGGAIAYLTYLARADMHWRCSQAVTVTSLKGNINGG